MSDPKFSFSVRTTQKKTYKKQLFFRGLSVQRSSQKSLSFRDQLSPLSSPARMAASPRIPQVSHACVLGSAQGIDVAMRRPPVLRGKRRQQAKEAEERIGPGFPVNHPILVSLGGRGVCLFACCVRGLVCVSGRMC